MIIAYAVFDGGRILALFGLGLGVFTAMASLIELYERAARQSAGIGDALGRMVRLPASAWGTAMAHFGVGVFVIGVASTAFHEEKIANMKAGEEISVGGYVLHLNEIVSSRGPNFIYRTANFTVRDADGRIVGEMAPASAASTPAPCRPPRHRG